VEQLDELDGFVQIDLATGLARRRRRLNSAVVHGALSGG